jgi:hypothetical protein
MPVMKLYANYVKNYEQIEAALRKHEKRTRFAALIKECKAMPANRRKLPLSAYLIMPIQRVARCVYMHTPAQEPRQRTQHTHTHTHTRYRLLALEILRHTPDEHLDRGQMEAAVEQLQALCLWLAPSASGWPRHHQRLQTRRGLAQDVPPSHRPSHHWRAGTHLSPAQRPVARIADAV